MNIFMKKIYFFTAILTVFALANIAQAQVWSAPTAPPPVPNVSTPINVSSTGQTKVGGLTLNTGGAIYGLLVPFGKVGIGTKTPGGIFDVFGSSGVALTVLADGKVGIGIATPASQLSVSGGVQVGTDTATCTTVKAGTMRWNVSSIQVCDGSSWVAASTGSGIISVGQMVGYGEAIYGSTYAPYPIGSVGVFDCQGTSVPAWCDFNAAKVLGNTAGIGEILYGCGTGYTKTIKNSYRSMYEFGYGSDVWHEIFVCNRNTTSIGASCSANLGCPVGVDGAKCSSFTQAYSSAFVGGGISYGQFPQCSSLQTTSTCTNGTWSPTPARYSSCIYGPSPVPPPVVYICDDDEC